LVARVFEARIVDCGGVALCEVERGDQSCGVTVCAHAPQADHVVVAVDARDDDSVFASSDEFGVHHDPRDASVAVVKGVNFGDDEHLEEGAREGGGKSAREFEALSQSSTDEARLDKEQAAGFVSLFLELAGLLARTAFENDSVPAAEKFEVAVCGSCEPAHLAAVGDDAVCPEDVMRVSGSVSGEAFVNGDFDGLVDAEAGSFDVVGEVGLEEWEVPVAAGAGICNGTDDWRAFLEGAFELFEELEPFRVVRLAACPRAQARGVGAPLACAECASDQGVN
jgi:hypothetical protein